MERTEDFKQPAPWQNAPGAWLTNADRSRHRLYTDAILQSGLKMHIGRGMTRAGTATDETSIGVYLDEEFRDASKFWDVVRRLEAENSL